MDLQKKFSGGRLWKTIDCGDGDTFRVELDPRAYSFTQQIEWAARYSATAGPPLLNDDGSPQLDENGEPKRALTAELAKVILEWAQGIVVGFEGLEIGGEPVTADAEGFAKLSHYPEILMLLFDQVTDAVSVKKKSATT